MVGTPLVTFQPQTQLADLCIISIRIWATAVLISSVVRDGTTAIIGVRSQKYPVYSISWFRRGQGFESIAQEAMTNAIEGAA